MKETKKQLEVREACVKFVESWMSHADGISRAANEEGINIFLRGSARATVKPLGVVEQALQGYRTIGTMSVNVEEDGVMKSLSCNENTPTARVMGSWWSVLCAEISASTEVAQKLRDQGVPAVSLGELGQAADPIREVQGGNANPLAAMMGGATSRYEDDQFLVVFEPSSAPSAANGRWTNAAPKSQPQVFNGIEH